VSARVIDAFQTTAPRKVALIISKNHREVSAKLLHDLGRGVTYLEGAGAYTQTEFSVIMCVMTRFEVVDVRRIVSEVDSSAFMIFLDAPEVVGNFERKMPRLLP
jgi:uncharacterized membrane-anchored protein YitT (DUF2179 family)